MPSHEELITALLPHWYATRAWAERLLCEAFGLEHAQDILRRKGKGKAHPIPGSTWMYRAHGIGVDIDRGIGSGGIDFDFNQDHPDVWRLRVFAEKQYNAGNLPQEYFTIVDDDARFEAAAQRVLDTLPGRSMQKRKGQNKSG